MKAKKIDLYLEIDGVILTRGVTPAPHLETFLAYILDNYSVSWLTSWCKGNNVPTVKYLSRFLSRECVALVKKIKPTNFILDKTEAIDFNKNFFWLDKELFDSEKNTLKRHDVYESWIELNLMKNPNQLLDLVNNELSVTKQVLGGGETYDRRRQKSRIY